MYNETRPSSFLNLNNGIWYYNYNIISEVVKDENGLEYTRYKHDYVRINGIPTISKCYEAVLKNYIYNRESLYNIINNPILDKEALLIAEDIYEMVEVDFGVRERISDLEKTKKNKIRLIDDYDKSSEVNSFFLNGNRVWLDKDTRVGLMNSLTIEKSTGKKESTLWFNNICITINCDSAMLLLGALELYALECYNKTAEHKLAVTNLNTEEDILNYDYTTGYPDKLIFNI